jgi:hypothetical protein
MVIITRKEGEEFEVLSWRNEESWKLFSPPSVSFCIMSRDVLDEVGSRYNGTELLLRILHH